MNSCSFRYITDTITPRLYYRASQKCIAFAPRIIDPVPQLFQRQEDEDRRRLQTSPSWQPALEHEHCALVL